MPALGTASISDQPLSRHLPGLDLLRAIAIGWVMCFHSFLVGGLNHHFAWLSRFGWMGVDLFFVLSGFLIGSQVLYPLTHGQPFSLQVFYLRRALRILPAFWVVLALYLAFPWFREEPGLEPWWKFATFIVNLSINYVPNQAFSHAWSLCVEEHFYLCFPVLAWVLTRRLSARAFVTVALTLVALGIASRTATWLHDSHLATVRNWFVEDIYFPTWNRLDGLLAGVALAALKTSRPGAWQALGAYANRALIGGVLILIFACWLFWNRTGVLANSIGWPILSLGLALLVFAGAQRNGLLGRRALPGAAWVAVVSYSLYLVHKPIYHIVQALYGDALSHNGLLAFASYTAASLFGAALLHYLVERPGLKLRDRLLSRTSSANLRAPMMRIEPKSTPP
jgi:peptidoglycan/LPS O-acetylase OafA/YrhL